MLHEINVSEIKENPFELIGKDWSLITSGDEKGFNTMTASWGSMGIMWSKNVVTVFIRPQRYTREFVDKNDKFTVSFYPESCREALKICGSKSGRDCDKVKEAGLTPVFDEGTTYFKEAKLVLECRKIYTDTIKPERFLDPSINEHYSKKDYHIVYMGEITKVLSE